MELLAPAGGRDAFFAAIENGADAVYIGGTSFSARQSAENFDNEQIKAAVDYAHLRDRKIYVTVNTLIDNNEFSEVLDYIYTLHNKSVDAIIVQDLGLMNAVRKTMPSVRIHASTQMTIHNAEGVNFLREQGIKRIVLARELSRDDLSAIRRETGDVELEIFVHGALCYCYSGQCLFSSIVGGRSGNRGRCAQPCRLGYDLYSGKRAARLDLEGQGRHLLSPADLCLLDYLGEIKKVGVTSLKIEGRMKRPEYVAIVTRIYREVLDKLQDSPNYEPSAE
jgi:putative protease